MVPEEEIKAPQGKGGKGGKGDGRGGRGGKGEGRGGGRGGRPGPASRRISCARNGELLNARQRFAPVKRGSGLGIGWLRVYAYSYPFAGTLWRGCAEGRSGSSASVSAGVVRRLRQGTGRANGRVGVGCVLQRCSALCVMLVLLPPPRRRGSRLGGGAPRASFKPRAAQSQQRPGICYTYILTYIFSRFKGI
eukprot:scaffold282_cov118-Isochrysis_galbana.AAC.7